MTRLITLDEAFGPSSGSGTAPSRLITLDDAFPPAPPRMTERLRDAVPSPFDLAGRAISAAPEIGREVAATAPQVLPGAAGATGAMVQGAGARLDAASQNRRPFVDDIRRAPGMSPAELTQLRKRIEAASPNDRAALQGVLSDVLDGSLTADEIDGALFEGSGEGRGLVQQGERLSKSLDETFPLPEEYKDSYIGKVFRGAGSTLPMMAAGIIGGPVGTAASAVAMAAGEADERARQAGATDEERRLATLWATIPGLTEIIPVERFIRIPFLKQRAMDSLKDIAVSATVEGVQEAVATFQQNLISALIYDADQGLLDEVVESGAVGAGVGALIETLRQAASVPFGRRRGGGASVEQPPPGDTPAPEPALGPMPAAPPAVEVPANVPEGAMPADSVIGTVDEAPEAQPVNPRLNQGDVESPIATETINEGKNLIDEVLANPQAQTPRNPTETPRVGSVGSAVSTPADADSRQFTPQIANNVQAPAGVQRGAWPEAPAQAPQSPARAPQTVPAPETAQTPAVAAQPAPEPAPEASTVAAADKIQSATAARLLLKDGATDAPGTPLVYDGFRNGRYVFRPQGKNQRERFAFPPAMLDDIVAGKSLPSGGSRFIEASRPQATQPAPTVSEKGGVFPGNSSPEPAVAAPPAGQSATATARAPIASRPSRADTAVTSTGREVPVRYAVVEASDLVASQTDDGAPNPAYPADLQPRDRTRGVSAAQISDIAQNLNPRLLGPSPKASDGAPIISPDGIVESGNGRTLALRAAYARGLPGAKAYRDYLASEGFDTAGMTAPVLVRVRDGDMAPEDRKAFTREANQRDTLGMSATEQAMADAAAISDDMLSQYRGGDVDAAGNRDFVRRFIRDVVGPNDQAGMVGSDGALSQDAIRRIQGALLGKAYGDPELVASLIESPDANIKAIGGALLDVAPQWAAMRADVRAGAINPDSDQTDALLESVRIVQRARREGRPIFEYVNQRDIFSGSTVGPMALAFLRIMFRNRQSWTSPAGRDRMAEDLTSYATEARKSAPGTDLLGNAPVAPDAILERIVERRDEKQQPAGQLALTDVPRGAGTGGPDAGIEREPRGQQDLQAGQADGRGEISREGDRAERAEAQPVEPAKPPRQRPARAPKAEPAPEPALAPWPPVRKPGDGKLYPDTSDHTALGQYPIPVSPTRAGKDAQDYVVRLGKETGVEHLVAFDADGAVVGHGRGTRSGTGLPGTVGAALMNPARSLIVHHNHPASRSFSAADFSFLAFPSVAGVWAHGHDGTWQRAEITPEGRAALNRHLNIGQNPEPERLIQAQAIMSGRLSRVFQRGAVFTISQAAVLARAMTADQVQIPHSAAFVEAVRRAGLVRLISTRAAILDGNPLGDIEGQINADAETIAKQIFGTAPIRVDDRGRAEPLRHIGDLGIVDDESEGAAVKRSGSRARPAASSANRSPDAEGSGSDVAQRLPGRRRNPSELDRLANYYRPGRIIEHSNGDRDRVIRFQTDGENWTVTVQAVDAEGNAIPGEGQRTHSTRPEKWRMDRWEKDNPPKANQSDQLATDLPMAQIRRRGLISADPIPIADYRSDSDIKQHPDYRAAKAGDVEAATRLVLDLVKAASLRAAQSRFGPDAIYAPVIAEERSGRNAIPEMLASYYAEATGATRVADIVQTNRAYHTGASAMERMIARATFDGPVRAGGRYVIVDDVSVMGSTLADMADHIERNGGAVSGVVLLANASRVGILKPSRDAVRKIKGRFGDAVQDLFGIDPDGLTAAESAYILNFRDADALRTRSTAAERERQARIRPQSVPSAQANADEVAAPDRDDDAGTFAIREEAGPVTTELVLTDRFVAASRDLESRLRSALDKMGLKDVAVRVPEAIRFLIGGGAYVADGRYHRGIIDVALDTADAGRTLRHEAIHAMRKMGLFTESEWSILSAKSRREWMGKYKIAEAYGGFPEWAQVEEGVAHAFADRGTETGMFRRLLDRIANFIEALGNALRGAGFQSAEGIFQRAASGEIGARPRDAFGRFATTAEPAFDTRSDPKTAAQSKSAMTTLLAKGQPIDRAIRLPFDFFGGFNAQGEWNPGKKLRDKLGTEGLYGLSLSGVIGAGVGTFAGGPVGTVVGGTLGATVGTVLMKGNFTRGGRMGWMAPFVENARRGLLDRYGLDQDYIARDRARERERRSILQEAADIMQVLRNANVGGAESRVLQSILTGEAVADKDMSLIAAPIRKAIDDMGATAVELGLINAESYERNRGAYLHRVYAKHEQDDKGLAGWVSRTMTASRRKIIGDQMKGRGIFLDLDMARLMRDVPGFREGERGTAALGEKFRVLDYVPGRSDDIVTGETREAKATRRVYLPADKPAPKQYQGEGWTDKGTFEIRKVGTGKATLWRDYTKPEREKMGEILDARYTIAKTFMLMANDLSTGKFFRDIAQNEAWARSDEPATRWVESGRYDRYWNDPEIAWVRVSDETIANSGGKKRYGAIAGRYVRAEIWRDMKEVEIANSPATWRQVMSIWKVNKTARSPVVHMNNIMSNLIFMDLADVRMQDLARGIRAFIDKNDDYNEARDNGAFGADMISQEIRDNVLQPILDEIAGQAQGGAQNSLIARVGLIARAQALGVVADKIWTWAKTADKKMVQAYQLEDEIFRMATYLRRRELGESAEVAALNAREQFLDYDIRAPWVNAARNSVLPFISYTYRAVPKIAESIMLRPWKLMKYTALAFAANALAYMWDDGDDGEERERASLREEEQGYTWFGIPRMLRMPWRDEHGLPVFMDVRRWIPAGDVFDTNQGQSALPVPAPLQFGGPLMLGAEFALNRMAFTGQDINNDLTDDNLDKTANVADWAWKSWMPSAAWIYNSWYWTRIGDAMRGAEDAQGRQYSLPQAVASSVGIKLRPQDVDQGLAWRFRDLERVGNALRQDMRRLAQRRERNMISQAEFERGMARIMEKYGRVGDKADDLGRRAAGKQSQ